MIRGPFRPANHSFRNATSGSIDAARRAGIYTAAIATSVSSAAVAPTVPETQL